jgi:molybdate/tungstate transport system permease protein
MSAQSIRTRSVGLSPDWLTVALLLGGVLLVYYLAPMVSLFLSVPPREVI